MRAETSPGRRDRACARQPDAQACGGSERGNFGLLSCWRREVWRPQSAIAAFRSSRGRQAVFAPAKEISCPRDGPRDASSRRTGSLLLPCQAYTCAQQLPRRNFVPLSFDAKKAAAEVAAAAHDWAGRLQTDLRQQLGLPQREVLTFSFSASRPTAPTTTLSPIT